MPSLIRRRMVLLDIDISAAALFEAEVGGDEVSAACNELEELDATSHSGRIGTN